MGRSSKRCTWHAQTWKRSSRSSTDAKRICGGAIGFEQLAPSAGHQRETAASQGASRRCQEVPDRICSACSSRRSSVNDQQPLRPQEPAAHNHQHALGTLLSRGTASQSIVEALRSPLLQGMLQAWMHRQQFCRCFRFCAFEVSSSTPAIRVLDADAHVVEVALQ
jgi:hypothetical protein